MKSFVFNLFLLASSSWAVAENFYLAPTPRGFQGIGQLETTTSRRFDSETESDVLTYNPIPCHFKYVMKNSPGFFCGTAGSLGSKRFLIDLDLMLTHSFHKNVDFRFHAIKKQDFADQSEAEVLELIYRFSDQFGMGLHGQFDSFKSEDDLGVSAFFHGDQFLSRVEFNAFDYSRNNRNEQSDRFLTQPYSVDASFLKISAGRQFYINLHFEPQWEWHSLTPVSEASQSRHVIEGFTWKDRDFFSFESTQTMTHLNQTYEDEKRLVLHGEKGIERWRVGARGVRKSWRTEDGHLIHHDLLPFVWARLIPQLPQVDLGYEVTWHSSEGDQSAAFEHRFNVSWDVLVNQDGYFKLFFTFDVDRFGSGETWEGGNGQIVFNF